MNTVTEMKQSKTAILAVLSLVVIASLMAAGCTGTGETPEETTLTVFTAASLTGAFTDIARAYEVRTNQSRPGLRRFTDAPHPDRAGSKRRYLRIRKYKAHASPPEQRVHG